MATTLASLVVRIGADVTGVTAGMNTLEKRTRRLKKQFSSVTDSTLTWQGALGVLAGASGVAFAAKAIFELGASIGETASKFDTVFGPSVQGAQKFLDEFAATAGLTVTEGREVLATTGAIAQGMGLSQRASAGFAQEVVKLAGDLTSFNDVPIQETSRAIQSALTGERESLKRLGIVILETDVQKRAMQMTGKDLAKSLTQEEKAHATLALITERAGVAVGDLARTKDSAANRARKLRADVLNLRDSFATAMLPALTVVLGELVKVAGSGGIAGLSQKIQESSPIIAAWAKFAVETFKTVAMAIAAPVRILFNLGQQLGEVGNALGALLTGNMKGFIESAGRMSQNWTDMGAAITNVIDGFDHMRVASGAAWRVMAGAAPAADVVANAQTATDGLGLSIDNLAKKSVTAFTAILPLPELLASAARSARKEFDLTAAMVEEFGFAVGDVALQGVDAIIDFASGAKNAIGDFVKSAISDLARLTAKMLIIRGIMKFLPGVGSFLGFGGLFGGGRAAGGPVQGGRAYVVGEKGPELFVPQTSGSIVPNGAQTITVNVGPAHDPITFARDQQWLRAIHEANVQLAAQGAPA